MADRLIRHDRRVAVNSLGAAFAMWRDRLAGAAVLLVAPLLLRAWVEGQSAGAATLAAAIVGALLGAGVTRSIARRLSFHETDGVLTVDALNAAARGRYRAAGHGAALALWTAILVIVRPSLLPLGLAGYGAGALAALVAERCWRAAWGARPASLGSAIRAASRRPIAGLAGAALLLASLPVAQLWGPSAPPIWAGAVTAVIALLLTPVDDQLVRFMALVGQGSARILGHHLRAWTLFAPLAVAGSWLMIGPGAAAPVALAATGVLMLLVIRLLAYRLWRRPVADWLVAAVLALFGLIAQLMPPALPIALLGVLWWLHRQGQARRWLLA
ncbi:MAG: hypothetical protein K2X76_16785 [Sphingomonas sp.]|nr:hypothetical protein [Sphingomonas sp.]